MRASHSCYGMGIPILVMEWVVPILVMEWELPILVMEWHLPISVVLLVLLFTVFFVCR